MGSSSPLLISPFATLLQSLIGHGWWPAGWQERGRMGDATSAPDNWIHRLGPAHHFGGIHVRACPLLFSLLH